MTAATICCSNARAAREVLVRRRRDNQIKAEKIGRDDQCAARRLHAKRCGGHMKRSAPPDASIVSPVTKPLREEPRKAAMAAISSAFPARPTGVSSAEIRESI